MSEHFKVMPAVFLVLIKDGTVLLARRANTGHQDGNYGFPAGHLEQGESVREGIVREAREEVAVILETEDMSVVHVMQRNKDVPGKEYVDFYLTANHWAGEPKNNEPEKCDDVAWFPLDNLPPNTIPYVRQAIDCIRRNQPFSEFSFN